MKIRQSDIRVFQDCALRYRYQNLDKAPREQSCALTFGTIIHEAILSLEQTRDLVDATMRFEHWWRDPTSLTGHGDLTIDYFLPTRNWDKYRREGRDALAWWWDIIRWDADEVLAREYQFTVPIGEHELTGTVDKLAIRHDAKLDLDTVLVSDYKTSKKLPTYEYLNDDIQFTAYLFATTQPEFWTNVPDGEALYDKYKDAPRHGEWVHLRGPTRRDVGERQEHHYRRLAYAIDTIAESIALRIFVPNISGTTCKFCEFRNRCGLPPIERQEA